MSIKPANVDQYLESGCGRCVLGGTPQCKVQSWVEELRLLRGILQESELIEEVKWSAPCYTHDGKNILMLSALKESVALVIVSASGTRTRRKSIPKPPDLLDSFGKYRGLRPER